MKLLSRWGNSAADSKNVPALQGTYPNRLSPGFLKLTGIRWKCICTALGIMSCSFSGVLAQEVPNMAWSCGTNSSEFNPPNTYVVCASEHFINEWMDRVATAHVVFSLKGFTYDDQGKITEAETVVRPLADAQAHIAYTHPGWGGTTQTPASVIGAVAYHYGRVNAMPGAPAGATIPLRIRLLGHASASSSRLGPEGESSAWAYSTFQCGLIYVFSQVFANASGPTTAEYDQTITCDVRAGEVFECNVHASAYAQALVTFSNEHQTGEAQAVADPSVEIDPSYAFKEFFTLEFSTGLVFTLAPLDLVLQSVTTDSVASVLNFQYSIQVPTNYPQNGETVWFARVYGTNGISTNGVFWQVDTNDANHVSLTVTNNIQGEVVLFATYSKTSDFKLVANPAVVYPYPSGTALCGIDMMPPFAVLSTGEVLTTSIWGIYSNGIRSLLYIPCGQASYQSANTNIASVNTNGLVTLLSTGSTTIAASYSGFAASMVVSSSATGSTSMIGVSGDLAFGLVEVGAMATRTMTIGNGGNSQLSVTNILYPTSFSGSWTGVVSPGSSTTVNVTFAPAGVTSYVGTVTVQSDATGGSNTISVSGTGTAPVRVIGLGGDLAFGLVLAGVSESRMMTIANTGTSILTVTNISYPSGFSGSWTGMVSPGGATNVAVVFAPSGAVSYGGTVTVHSDATGGTNAISVSGTGWQGYTNLYVFKGGSLDGANPDGSLLLSGSILYGMTERGGDVGYSSDNGVIFRIGDNGNGMSIMHHFGGPMSDAGSPWSSFIQSGTNLYGMTYHGGDGGGTIIKISTNGDGYAILHRFGVFGAIDGQWPYGDFVQSGSWLYGMARFGGTSDGGVAFKFNVDGTGYTNIHSFAGPPSDGYEPFGSLTLSGSTFYGMTFNGGTYGGGVVFRMNLDGSGYTILRNLHYGGGNYDGIQPYGSLVLSGSMLYGMTSAGGVSNLGVVFGISTNGTGYTNLHHFAAGPSDGAMPFGSLTVTGSMLYGMTSAGGVWNSGTVFQMSMTGAGYTNLHNFAGGTGDGASPQGALTLSGSLVYGMTKYGGISNAGTVFVLALPSSGPAGYDAWAASITNGLTNFNQCATGDGYPNLLKYATGSSPTDADNLASLTATNSAGLLSLRFNRNTNARDVTLLVEGGYAVTNGAPWTGVATNRNGSWGASTNVDETPGTPTAVTVRDTAQPATNRFLRLRVTRP